MLFAVIKLCKYLLLMGTVIFGTMIFKKMKISEKARKIASTSVVIFAVILFFVPFDEIITFGSSDTAFAGTVLGDQIAEAEGEKSHGVFFRDKRGTYSTVFFYKEDGRYHKCAAENREALASGEVNGIYADVFRIADTEDCYVIVRGYDSALAVTDSDGSVFDRGELTHSKGTLVCFMAEIDYDADYTLTVNGNVFTLE